MSWLNKILAHQRGPKGLGQGFDFLCMQPTGLDNLITQAKSTFNNSSHIQLGFNI